MHRAGLLALGFALAGPASVAQASIPPSYRVMVVSGDAESAARSEALVQFMSELGAFARKEPLPLERDVRTCLQQTEFETCARAFVPKPEHWQDPPHIVIRAEDAGAGRIAWTCVGSGAYRPPTDAHQTQVDARTAIFGEGDEQSAALSGAMDCIRSAALESSRP